MISWFIINFITGRRRNFNLQLLDILIISWFITGKRRGPNLIKYGDTRYHDSSLYYREKRNSISIKYSGNIMIYHSITGRKRNSFLIKYFDDINWFITLSHWLSIWMYTTCEPASHARQTRKAWTKDAGHEQNMQAIDISFQTGRL